MNHKQIAENIHKNKFWRYLTDGDRVFRWARIAFIICFAVIAVLLATDISLKNQWNIGKWIIAISVIFIIIWLFYMLCLWLAKPLLYAYIKAHEASIRMNIELDEFDSKIHSIIKKEETPLSTQVSDNERINYDHLNLTNQFENARQRMESLMKQYEIDRKVMKERRQKEDPKFKTQVQSD